MLEVIVRKKFRDKYTGRIYLAGAKMKLGEERVADLLETLGPMYLYVIDGADAEPPVDTEPPADAEPSANAETPVEAEPPAKKGRAKNGGNSDKPA